MRNAFRLSMLLFSLVDNDLIAQNQNNEQVSPTVTINLSGTVISSNGTVTYFANGNGNFSGFHNFTSGAASHPFSNVQSYAGSISTTSPGCHRATVYAVGVFGTQQTVTSGQVCRQTKTVSCDNPNADGSCPGGPTGGMCEGTGEVTEECPLSPIVLDLSGNGYKLTGISEPVTFDLDADGRLDVVGWTRGGSENAFLALDLNRNGAIDDGRELFGDATLTPTGRATNGFEGLSQYDENGDAVVDSADPIWSSLLLWTDRNHNGQSEGEEIVPLAGSPIHSLGVDYRWTGRRDASGNAFRYTGSVMFGNHRRQYYDIFFVRQQ